MSNQIDLSTDINLDIKSGFDNRAVQSAIKLIEKAELIRSSKEGEWAAIQDLFEQGFTVTNPTGTRRIESQLLWQAIYRVVSKMKPLDGTLHATGANEMIEKVVTDGVATVLRKGGFVNSLRDDFGGFYRMALFGDAFIRIGADEENMDYPIKFQNTSLLNVYVDPYAIGMRSPASEKDVDELCAVYKYSWDEAIKIFPELEDIGGLGEIPRKQKEMQDMEYDEMQEMQIMDREVEIAHYYNLSHKNYTIFAGKQATVLREFKDGDYPFVKDGKPFIPFLHFKCFPASEGFYNYGIGHILYRLAILTRQLQNGAYNYSFDNIDPIRVVNVPRGERSKFFNRLLAAQEARAKGRKGFVVNEYNANEPNGGQIFQETFDSKPLTQEWERLYQRLDQEISRMGINLDDVDRGASRTATQIIAEEENQDAFVKQIMEQNASEFEFVWELSIEFIKKYISKGNKAPLNLTTNVEVGGAQAIIKGLTMGELSEELKDKSYFVRINARSGAYPSNVLQQAQLSRAIALAQPGTMAFNKLASKMMQLNDQDISMADLQGQGQPGGGEEAGQPIASETENLKATGPKDLEVQM